jgi:hypothetical protein
MSRGDWISLISAIATVAATVVAAIAVIVSTRQFKLSAQQSRADRQEEAVERIADASAARQIRFDDATEARQLRQEEAKNARDIRLEEARKNWLLTVIIQPSLTIINIFYDGIISTTMIALDDLINASATQASNPLGMNKLKLQRAGVINNLKQQFDHSFVILVATQNYVFGQKLRTALNELEDMITNEIGKIDYSQVDKFLLSEKLYEHKSKFFSLLYREVQEESK